MKLKLDPTVPKVIIIAVLLFCEGFAIPTYTVITQNRFPTPYEFISFLLAAFIQLITYLLTFLETGVAPTPTPPKTPSENSCQT